MNSLTDISQPVAPHRAPAPSLSFPSKYLGSILVPQPGTTPEMARVMRCVKTRARKSDEDKFVCLYVTSDAVEIRGSTTTSTWKRLKRLPWKILPSNHDDGLYHQQTQKTKQLWYQQKQLTRRQQSLEPRKRRCKLPFRLFPKSRDARPVYCHQSSFTGVQRPKREAKAKEFVFLSYVKDLLLITYDTRDPRIFCYVQKEDGVESCQCHVFKSPTKEQSMRVVQVINQIYKSAHENSEEPETRPNVESGSTVNLNSRTIPIEQSVECLAGAAQIASHFAQPLESRLDADGDAGIWCHDLDGPNLDFPSTSDTSSHGEPGVTTAANISEDAACLKKSVSRVELESMASKDKTEARIRKMEKRLEAEIQMRLEAEDRIENLSKINEILIGEVALLGKELNDLKSIATGNMQRLQCCHQKCLGENQDLEMKLSVKEAGNQSPDSGHVDMSSAQTSDYSEEEFTLFDKKDFLGFQGISQTAQPQRETHFDPETFEFTDVSLSAGSVTILQHFEEMSIESDYEKQALVDNEKLCENVNEKENAKVGKKAEEEAQLYYNKNEVENAKLGLDLVETREEANLFKKADGVKGNERKIASPNEYGKRKEEKLTSIQSSNDESNLEFSRSRKTSIDNKLFCQDLSVGFYFKTLSIPESMA